MQSKAMIPVVAAALFVAAMIWQGLETEPVVCEAPDVHLAEISGFTSEALPASEAETTTLPSDTIIEKRMYKAEDGAWYAVTLVVGGHSKSSIHRPELCLPSQGFMMTNPRGCSVDGVDWHMLSLSRRDAQSLSFAYTFFNQDGFRTSSHVARIFRDVWDRSIKGRIDRWAMVTVNGSPDDERRMRAFLASLKKEVFKW